MNKPKDDLKWFGEGFDGFPRHLPEDCVEYTIHIIGSKLNALEKREKLRKVQSAGLKLTSELTKGFIWQRDSFNLRLEREAGESSLRGRINFGDSVEDEWLVVYILRELSKKFPEVWIRVVDTDGQFLLIEAAGVLPRWLNPEIADYRIWLNNGRLLIIGLEKSDSGPNQTKSEPSNPLDLDKALAIIEHHPDRLIDSPKIQAEAFHRLQKYPQHILDSLHHAAVHLPRKLAYILHQDPALVSPAIEAFYLRDPIALRPLQAHKTDELLFPPIDFVRVCTKFTKVGYAQLKSQQFDTPTVWARSLAFNSDAKVPRELEIGMKLTCGFEMLVSDPQNQDNKAVRNIKIILEDIRTGEDSLPTDAIISSWDMREDDEKWLDVNFEEFEKELGGGDTSGDGGNGAFGDKHAQDNLRKMVSRFQEFLHDNAAGVEGAELLDDMDRDDGENEDDDDENVCDENGPATEEQGIDFDEDEFTRMLQQMMGMEKATSVGMDDGAGKDLRENMHAVENELRDAGALQLNPKQDSDESLRLSRAIDTGPSGDDHPAYSLEMRRDVEDEDLDIDYNLAKNLLESLKSQEGATGPGSSLMGLMGLQMPRDEHEED